MLLITKIKIKYFFRGTCKKCSYNEYSLNPTEECKTCPNGGICINGILSLKEGLYKFWKYLTNNNKDIGDLQQTQI